MPDVLIDLTEFMGNPIRTGVQRVVREILTNWPSDIPLVPVEYDAARDALVHVDQGSLAFARDYADNPHVSVTEARQEMAMRRKGSVAAVPTGATIVVPELFFEKNRALYYARAKHPRRTTSFIVYDFLPWRFPELFHLTQAAPLNYYLLAASRAAPRCFISEPVRADYYRLIAHAPPGPDPTIILGNDGLGVARGAAAGAPLGCYFLCFGAFDGRKGQQVVLEAFLASEVSRTTKLVFAGRFPETVPAVLKPVFACTHPNVTVLDDPSDKELADLVVGSRAVVFISEMEGYGLPATEALYAGVPVIVSATLPSALSLPNEGQITLPICDVAAIKAALERLADDREAADLKAATARLQLPTWADYGRSVAEWSIGRDRMDGRGVLPD